MDTNQPTLLNMTPRCFSCGDLGIDLSTDGVISRCWRLAAGADHNEPNEAAKMVARAIHQLRIEKVPVDQHIFHVAKTLINYTSDRPCKRDDLINKHFTHTPSSLRNFHAAIETLRKTWLLPVGSRKGGSHESAPVGYWVITNIEDFAEWVETAKAAPITQLTTIHRVAKRNFPVFADQMEFEFWNDIEPQRLAAAA